MIIMTKSRKWKSHGVEDRLEAPLKIGWNLNQDNIAIVESRAYEHHHQRVKAVVGNIPKNLIKLAQCSKTT